MVPLRIIIYWNYIITTPNFRLQYPFIPIFFLIFFSQSYGHENQSKLDGEYITVPLKSTLGGGPIVMEMTIVGNRERKRS